MTEVLGRKMTLEDQFLVFIVAPICSYLMPVQPVLVSLGVIIFMDTILGIWAAKKSGEKIVSSRGWRVFQKICVMIVVIIGMHAYEDLSKGMIPAVTMAATGFALFEVLSILENAQRILGVPLFKFLIKKLDSKNINKPKGE